MRVLHKVSCCADEGRAPRLTHVNVDQTHDSVDFHSVFISKFILEATPSSEVILERMQVKSIVLVKSGITLSTRLPVHVGCLLFMK